MHALRFRVTTRDDTYRVRTVQYQVCGDSQNLLRSCAAAALMRDASGQSNKKDREDSQNLPRSCDAAALIRNAVGPADKQYDVLRGRNPTAAFLYHPLVFAVERRQNITPTRSVSTVINTSNDGNLLQTQSCLGKIFL